MTLMMAGRIDEAMTLVASGWAKHHALPTVETTGLLDAQLTMMSLFDPPEGIRLADDALTDLGETELEQTCRQLLLYLEGMCIAGLGEFAEAARIAEQSFVPQDSELRDFALTTWLWSSHLAGLEVGPERVVLAQTADMADGPWRQSVRVAAAIHLASP